MYRHANGKGLVQAFKSFSTNTTNKRHPTWAHLLWSGPQVSCKLQFSGQQWFSAWSIWRWVCQVRRLLPASFPFRLKACYTEEITGLQGVFIKLLSQNCYLYHRYQKLRSHFGGAISVGRVTTSDITVWECLLIRLLHSKCIRLGSVRSSHLPFKMYNVGYERSSLPILP